MVRLAVEKSVIHKHRQLDRKADDGDGDEQVPCLTITATVCVAATAQPFRAQTHFEPRDARHTTPRSLARLPARRRRVVRAVLAYLSVWARERRAQRPGSARLRL